jgi:hypothetical protein
VTQRLVSRHGFLEKPFLYIARKIRPQPQCSLSNNMRESSGVVGHASVFQKLESGVRRFLPVSTTQRFDVLSLG